MSTQIVTASTPQKASINKVFEAQKAHQYAIAQTDAKERIQRLRTMYKMLLDNQDAIRAALLADFSKPAIETDFTEIGNLTQALRHAISHLRSWMRTERVGTPLALLGSKSELRYEPKGVTLIISPWNYPFLLTFEPLIYAIAAGNTAILKPSEMTPNSAALMREMIENNFLNKEVAVFEGDAEVSKHLLTLPFNHIFFTGSPAIGKLVMKAAANHLASVTLELGGKSPVVIDPSANLDLAASRIAWFKGMNAGQICIAPDYVLVHESAHAKFCEKLKAAIQKLYGSTPSQRQNNPDLCRIVNKKHHLRIMGLLENAQANGAQTFMEHSYNVDDRFVDITPLTEVGEEATIWQEEIFGPLIPIRTYKTKEEAVSYIRNRPTPLAMYVFSKKSKNTEFFLRETKAGGVSVNDIGIHLYNHGLAFGGHNNSGIGKTHGLHGFRAFSNEKAVVHQKSPLPGTELVLPPYNRTISKWMVNWIVKWL